MARSVALYLTRFDAAPDKPPDDATFLLPEESSEVAEQFPQPEDQDAEKEKELRDSLIEEAKAAVRAEYESILENERAAFADRLRAERSVWANEEGERLSREFSEAIDELVKKLGSDLEKILEPFVVREIRVRMLDDFVSKLRLCLADRDNPVIQLSGPIDLLEMVCARLDSTNVPTNVAEIGGVDVRARLDSTTIETCLGDWLEQLRKED